MKTNEQVDAIMEAIPAQWRVRYCGAESGPCACLGCVYTGNKMVISEKITGSKYQGDPEYISEAKLRKSADIYEQYKLSKAEWLSWKERQANRGTKP